MFGLLSSTTLAGDDDEPACAADAATILGTSKDDVLQGTPHKDVIVGRKGRDVIRGFGGNDVLCGKGGQDRILGGDGNDLLTGGLASDELEGGSGTDVIKGGGFDDDMHGGAGADNLGGGPGDDRADGGPGLDKCEAETEISCNAPAQVKNDSHDVNEDATLNVAAPGVLANDTDADGDALTAVAGPGPSDGDLTLNPNGSFVYTPDPNFDGTDSFTYRANDGHVNSAPATVTIDVTPLNDGPTDITLADNSIDENKDIGSNVGTFTVDDPDTGDTNTLSLVAGSGDTDNARFMIDGSVLKTSEVFDFENDGPFSIRVRTTDSDNLQREEEFTITVVNVNEAPVVGSATFSLAENSATGTAVGTATFTDDDTGQGHT
ncbi:MAG: Ig-like domain-containing protein, partial [Actinomycetota bacterium]|nr:Ig-like domain-containing protein [Actinomycetota bacterium]